MVKKQKVEWPMLTVPCPDDITGQILRYWDDIFSPRKGDWIHPEDKKRHKKYRAAIATLLPFFER